jgi:hypothetical protein
MKKLNLLIAATIIAGNLVAQIPLEVKKADLSANGLSTKARFVGVSREPGKIKMTFSTKGCEINDLGATLEFKGTTHNFEHLIFDDQLNFKTLEKETVTGMANALAIAPVLGRNVEINQPYGYWQGAGREGSWLDQYMYYPKVYAATGTSAASSGCLERLEAKKTGSKIPFPGEGFLFASSSNQAVTSLTYTSEKGSETVNMIWRIFGLDGTSQKEKSFEVPYKNFAARILKLENGNGVTDFILVLQPTTSWNKYGVKVAETRTNPLEFDYFRIDGASLEVKERFTFTAINSQWLPEHALEQDGTLYIMGQCSDKAKLTGYAYGGYAVIEGANYQNSVRIDELENYQIVRVKNGKLAGVNVISPDDLEKVQKAVPGTKGSNSPSGYFRWQEYKFVGNHMYITGQNTSPGKAGDDRKQEFLLVLNSEGKPEQLFYVPKKNYANSNMFLSADKQSMYWAIYDYSEFDVTATRKEPTQIKIGFVTGGDDHVITNKTKNDDGPMLELVKIDLNTHTPSALQRCGEDEYTLFDEAPVFYANEQEVVFLGVSGKKKERVSNFIKLKL